MYRPDATTVLKTRRYHAPTGILVNRLPAPGRLRSDRDVGNVDQQQSEKAARSPRGGATIEDAGASEVNANQNWKVYHSEELEASGTHRYNSSKDITAGRFFAPARRGRPIHVGVIDQNISLLAG